MERWRFLLLKLFLNLLFSSCNDGFFGRPQGSRQVNCEAIRLSGKRSAAVFQDAPVLGSALGFDEAGKQLLLGILHCHGCRQICLRLGQRLQGKD